MNLLARAKRKTAVCSRPDDISTIQYWLNVNDELKLIEQKKIGLKTYYKTTDNLYINSQDLLIMRDNDFYYSNYSSKKLMRSNINLAGVSGLSVSLENSDDRLMPSWNFLQRFAEDPDNGETSEVSEKEVEDKKPKDPKTSNGNGSGGLLGGLIPNPFVATTPRTTPYSNESLNMQLSSIITTSNSTAGKLMQGITVGSVMDGSFWGQLGRNLLSWGINRLNYVVGFDIIGTLSNLFKIFGLDFNLNDIFGFDGLGLYAGYTYGDFTLPDSPYFDDTAIMERFNRYFQYKGSNGQYIAYRFANHTWYTPTYYDTPELQGTLERNPDDIKVFESIWNRDVDEFDEALKGVRQEFNLDVDRLTIVTKFNRFRVPTPDNELIGTRAHIFFTQPDLNLDFSTYIRDDTGKGKQITYGSRIGDLGMKLEQCHPTLLKYLGGGARTDGHGLIPIFTHCCTGFDVADDVLEHIEHGETFMGWKQMYGTSNIKSKTAGTMSIKFTDDDQLSIFKMIKLWVEYINAVWHGEVDPKQIHKDRHELDYAVAVYYFVTKHDDTEIAFWSKYTGVFPLSIPSSTFSDNLGQRLTRPEYNINWAFCRKEDYRPYHLAEFNRLVSNDGSDQNWEYMPLYNKETAHITKSFVGAPFVEAFEDGRFYKLRFRKP